MINFMFFKIVGNALDIFFIIPQAFLDYSKSLIDFINMVKQNLIFFILFMPGYLGNFNDGKLSQKHRVLAKSQAIGGLGRNPAQLKPPLTLSAHAMAPFVSPVP